MRVFFAAVVGLVYISLFACDDETAFYQLGDASVTDGTGSGSGTGTGSGSGNGGVSTPVANLSLVTDVANIDGVQQPDIKEVLMSDDGSVIMIVTKENMGNTNPQGHYQIYRVAESTGIATQITSFTDANNTGLTQIVIGLATVPVILAPVLSGDGSTLAFFHTYDPLGTNPDGGVELFVFDIVSDTLIQATDNLFTNITVMKPSITNDGSLLAFASRDNYTTQNPDGLNQIFTITTDGSNAITQITNNQFGGPGTGFFVGDADIESFNYHRAYYGVAISGDGSRIAFRGGGDWLNNGSTASNSSEIYFINIDGSGLTTVSASGSNFVTNPQISDDGNIIAFGQSEGANTPTEPANLYSYDVNTSTLTNLTNNTADQRFFEFALTGDGSTVIYRFQNDIKNTTSGSLDLVTISTDGLDLSSTIFSIPSQPIDDVNSFSWSQVVIPDFVYFPKTTTDGSKTAFATRPYRLPPATTAVAESQLYMATKP